MKQNNYLIEKQALLYQTKLQHINSLIERVEHGSDPMDVTELSNALTSIREERETLLYQIQHKSNPLYQEPSKDTAVPLLIKQAVADKLKGLVEKANI